MSGGRLRSIMALMHPTLTTVIASERNYELRMNAAYARRARFAVARGRRASARRARRVAPRLAHA
jgi:hypothetical protein